MLTKEEAVAKARTGRMGVLPEDTSLAEKLEHLGHEAYERRCQIAQLNTLLEQTIEEHATKQTQLETKIKETVDILKDLQSQFLDLSFQLVAENTKAQGEVAP